MTKKTYYQTLKKYQNLTEIRDFNNNYFGQQEELLECKKQLTKKLEQTLRSLDAYFHTGSGKIAGRNLEEVCSFYFRCEQLLLKIEEEQTVTERDYNRTFYRDLLIIGIFEGKTRPHLIR